MIADGQALLEELGTPESPAALAHWPWLGIRMRPGRKTLVNAAGEENAFAFRPLLTVNSIDAACQLAIAGAGLATPPAFLVENELAAGLLVEPLPGWRAAALGVYAVWPANAARASLTLRLVQHLAQTAG